MASNLNSEFNYKYQVIGSTPWEKLKTLQGFLVGQAGSKEDFFKLAAGVSSEDKNLLQ